MYRNKYFENEPHSFEELKEIVHALRDKEYGCSWDSVQTHESMKDGMLDEANEVLTAIDNKDDENLCEELGDVLLQVLLHSEVAMDRGAFTLDDVINMLSDKLIRRHPHVFGDVPRPTNENEALSVWKSVKLKEKRMKYKFYFEDGIINIKANSEKYPNIVRPFDLYDKLSEIWCEYTCAPRLRDKWSKENKTCGQCSISAFLAQDIFGGEVYGMKTDNGGLHLYNCVDGVCFDLASEQFGEEAKNLVYDKSMLQDRNMEHHFGKQEKYERYLYLKEHLK